MNVCARTDLEVVVVWCDGRQAILKLLQTLCMLLFRLFYLRCQLHLVLQQQTISLVKINLQRNPLTENFTDIKILF